MGHPIDPRSWPNNPEDSQKLENTEAGGRGDDRGTEFGLTSYLVNATRTAPSGNLSSSFGGTIGLGYSIVLTVITNSGGTSGHRARHVGGRTGHPQARSPSSFSSQPRGRVSAVRSVALAVH